jgi:hypothetical protein
VHHHYCALRFLDADGEEFYERFAGDEPAFADLDGAEIARRN